jgi:hypothetical protein
MCQSEIRNGSMSYEKDRCDGGQVVDFRTDNLSNGTRNSHHRINGRYAGVSPA